MTEATDLLSAASSGDLRAGLRAARALRRLADTLEAAHVDSARRQGWSWTEIAAALEVSKQAVHQRYGRRTPLAPTREA